MTKKSNIKMLSLSYEKAILIHCQEKLEEDRYKKFFENGITETNFEKFVTSRKEAKKSNEDKEIIDNFEKYTKTKNPYKPFVNFLKENTQRIAKIEALKMLAFLFDFTPRSEREYKKNPKTIPLIDNDEELLEPKASHQISPKKSELGLSSINKIIYLLGFIAFLLLIAVVSGVFNKPATQIGNQINTDTFNVNKNYYYYLDSGKVKLIDKNLLTKKDDVNAKTLTPIVLDRYFLEQGLDTTQQKIKLIKVNYFKSHPEIPIIDVDNEQVIKREPIQKIRKIVPENNKEKQKAQKQQGTSKSLSLDAVDIRLGDIKDDAVAGIVFNWLQQKSQNVVYKVNGTTQYTYRKSTNQKRDICDLTINATIHSKSGDKIIHKTISGTGFSKRTAKQNAVMKLEKYLVASSK